MTQPFQVTFETFVLSLGTATLVALGEIENPVTKTQDKNLETAKQHIDILDLLVQKTKGNLSENEDRLLNQVLYEMRMKYLESNKTTS